MVEMGRAVDTGVEVVDQVVGWRCIMKTWITMAPLRLMVGLVLTNTELQAQYINIKQRQICLRNEEVCTSIIMAMVHRQNVLTR